MARYDTLIKEAKSGKFRDTKERFKGIGDRTDKENGLPTKEDLSAVVENGLGLYPHESPEGIKWLNAKPSSIKGYGIQESAIPTESPLDSGVMAEEIPISPFKSAIRDLPTGGLSEDAPAQPATMAGNVPMSDEDKLAFRNKTDSTIGGIPTVPATNGKIGREYTDEVGEINQADVKAYQESIPSSSDKPLGPINASTATEPTKMVESGAQAKGLPGSVAQKTPQEIETGKTAEKVLGNTGAKDFWGGLSDYTSNLLKTGKDRATDVGMGLASIAGAPFELARQGLSELGNRPQQDLAPLLRGLQKGLTPKPPRFGIPYSFGETFGTAASESVGGYLDEQAQQQKLALQRQEQKQKLGLQEAQIKEHEAKAESLRGGLGTRPNDTLRVASSLWKQAGGAGDVNDYISEANKIIAEGKQTEATKAKKEQDVKTGKTQEDKNKATTAIRELNPDILGSKINALESVPEGDRTPEQKETLSLHKKNLSMVQKNGMKLTKEVQGEIYANTGKAWQEALPDDVKGAIDSIQKRSVKKFNDTVGTKMTPSNIPGLIVDRNGHHRFYDEEGNLSEPLSGADVNGASSANYEDRQAIKARYTMRPMRLGAALASYEQEKPEIIRLRSNITNKANFPGLEKFTNWNQLNSAIAKGGYINDPDRVVYDKKVLALADSMATAFGVQGGQWAFELAKELLNPNLAPETFERVLESHFNMLKSQYESYEPSRGKFSDIMNNKLISGKPQTSTSSGMGEAETKPSNKPKAELKHKTITSQQYDKIVSSQGSKEKAEAFMKENNLALGK